MGKRDLKKYIVFDIAISPLILFFLFKEKLVAGTTQLNCPIAAFASMQGDRKTVLALCLNVLSIMGRGRIPK